MLQWREIKRTRSFWDTILHQHPFEIVTDQFVSKDLCTGRLPAGLPIGEERFQVLAGEVFHYLGFRASGGLLAQGGWIPLGTWISVN